jgi:CelD/BcsL family acetyltransferase involved in cellulose biosynthesis
VIPAEEWEETTHHLKFLFGEYCFYRASFVAAEIKTHPTRLSSSLNESAAAALPLLRCCSAVAFPAYPVSEAPAWLAVSRDYLRYVAATGTYHFIELAGSFDEYMRRMARRHRHEWQRKLRRFAARGGGIGVRCYSTLAEADGFFALAAAISAKTYQHRLLGVGLPPTAAARDDLLARAKRNAMRGYVLFHRGAAIAYGLAAVTGDCLSFVHIGYDPAFADLSPGNILIYEALRAAFTEKRFALLDFGAGEAQYKRALATGSLTCATVFLFRPTAGRFLTAAAHHACRIVADGGTQLLDRLGAKERIKRHFRTRAAASPG